MSDAETELLAAILDETESLISGVRPDQAHLATPCTDLDVSALIDHLVGWATSFAARLTGGVFEGDPNDYRPSASC